MTQQKLRNPDVDFGFFAQIPRIIRTEHRDLTPVQKWLYTCLKDLCGETGTCYRTLRVLAQETDISTGMLSESIPALHKAGLIHAEKKKRSNSGKEVWHITIVDIWQANAKAHPTKRSHSEQTSENVHTVNDVVHRMNEDTGVCSCGERVCSLCETEGISSEGISFTEEVSGEEEREVATATARSQPSSQKEVVDGHTHQHPVVDRDLPANSHQPKLSQPEHRKDTNKITEPPAPRKPRTNSTLPQQGLMDTKSELPAKPPSKPVEPVAEMAWGTRKCLQWFDYWRGGTLIAKYKLQQAASCAKGLAEQFDEKTVIEIRTRMAKDPFWIERGGPDVCEVANNIHKEINKKQPSNEHKATQQPANAFIERCLDKDYNKRKLEEMRAKNALKRQAQAVKGV